MNKINSISPIFENEDFLAVSKPSGLLSVPDRMQSEASLKDMLKNKYGEIYTVHRLDKDTSGLILFAKNADVHKQLSLLFQHRTVQKLYVGFVLGNMAPSEGTISAPIREHPAKNGTMIADEKGKPSLTEYKTLESFRNYAFVQFQIHTGRTHQIRVHSKYLGHPIVADKLYGTGEPLLLSVIKRKFHLSKNESEERPLLGRLALHSYRISFQLNDIPYSIEAPLPKEFSATLQQLRKNNAL